MLGKVLMKALVFVATFMAWELYLKDAYYSWVTSQTGPVGLAEIAVGWAIPFGFAFLTSEILTRKLKLLEESESQNRFE